MMNKQQKIDQRNARMKLEYINSNCTYEDLAKRYNMTTQNVQRIANKNKWRLAKNEMQATLKKEKCDKLDKSLAIKKREVNIKHYKAWEKLLNVVTSILDNPNLYLTYKEVPGYNINKMEHLAAILEKIQNGQRLSSGLEDEVELMKVKIAQQKVNLEKEKANGGYDNIPAQSNFLKVVNESVDKIWSGKNEEKEN